MSETSWAAVDEYISGQLLKPDNALVSALQNNAAQGLPPIDVSATQGKMLMLLAQMAGAKHILEIGTLGGYSTIWLARALPDDGQLVSLEIDPEHAKVARENLERAGLSPKVQIVTGAALDSLRNMQQPAPFDFIFIDADKQNNVNYVEQAIRLARSGATIIVDNVVRDGGVLDASSDDERIIGTRKLFEHIANHPRLDATAIQTVSDKGWDGFLLARLR
jgi:predicted O-methyltransferase YrrM